MTKRKGILLVALAGVLVLVLGTAALAQTSSGSTTTTTGTGSFDLPGMGSARAATGTDTAAAADERGGMDLAGIGRMGDRAVTPPLRPLMDLPAARFACDAAGRVQMDLPALRMNSRPNFSACQPAAVAGPGPDVQPGPGRRPGRLPRTGVNAGDLFAAGMAALSAGGLFVRRIRLSLAG